MIDLVHKMTTIYFRLPDNVGITYKKIKKLIELKDRDYSDEAITKIKGIEKEIDSIIENQEEGYEDLILDKFNELDNIKSELRPFGNGVELQLVNKGDKLAWFSYKIQKSISEEEKEFIKDYIRNTLESNDAIIEVEDYELDKSLLKLNDFTKIRRITQ